MNTLNLSLNEVVSFINSQPSNKKINMDESSSEDGGCGCLMLHLFYHYFPNDSSVCEAGFLVVGTKSNTVRIPKSISHFLNQDNPPKNYGDAKELAKSW